MAAAGFVATAFASAMRAARTAIASARLGTAGGSGIAAGGSIRLTAVVSMRLTADASTLGASTRFGTGASTRAGGDSAASLRVGDAEVGCKPAALTVTVFTSTGLIGSVEPVDGAANESAELATGSGRAFGDALANA